jgi:hypothetical protein
VAWPLNHALPINAHSSHQHVLGTLASHWPGMPQEPRGAISSNRDSESSSHRSHYTSQSYHGGIDNTSSHLVKTIDKAQSESVSLPKSDSFSSLARVSSAFIPHPRTNAHRQPVRGFQPSSHPAVPIRRSIICVCVCLLNRTARHPHGTAVAVALQPGASMQGACSIIQKFILPAACHPATV